MKVDLTFKGKETNLCQDKYKDSEREQLTQHIKERKCFLFSNFDIGVMVRNDLQRYSSIAII
jgi:hypothetical protein